MEQPGVMGPSAVSARTERAPGGLSSDRMSPKV